jgi:hypothetical protein
VTEQEQITTPNESAVAPVAEKKSVKKSKSAKKTVAQTAKRSTPKTAAATHDEKRLARNAALREWRRKNADRVKSYMTAWRAKRAGKQPIIAAMSGKDAPARAAATKKKSTSQTKKGGKA